MCYLQLSSLSLAVCIPTAFLHSFDFLCGWASALIFEPVHRDSTVLASRVHVLQHALVQLHLRLSPALSHTLTHQHILTCWDIGFARVLHRSASPDSSLKCPWQPPNPQPSFPLCSCTFSSSTRLLMDAAIFLCLSPLECSHNHWAL